MPEAPGRTNRPAVLRNAVAIASVASAVILAQFLEHHWHSTPYVSLFLTAVMLSAWFGGYGPGLLAVVLAALAFDYYFLPPIGSLAVNPSEVPRLILFSRNWSRPPR